MLKKVVIGVGVAEPRYGGPKSLLTEKMTLVALTPRILFRVVTREVLATLPYW